MNQECETTNAKEITSKNFLFQWPDFETDQSLVSFESMQTEIVASFCRFYDVGKNENIFPFKFHFKRWISSSMSKNEKAKHYYGFMVLTSECFELNWDYLCEYNLIYKDFIC